MSKRKLGLFVLAVLVVGALLPAMFAPVMAEAEAIPYGWCIYTPNHPMGCAPLAYDCYVVYVWPDVP